MNDETRSDDIEDSDVVDIESDDTTASDEKKPTQKTSDKEISSDESEAQIDEEIAVEIDSANGDDVFEEPGVELEEAEHVNIESLKPILEGAILAAGESLTLVRMQSLFEEGQIPSKDHLREALNLIAEDCELRGFELCEVASGWRFQVRNTYAPWVNRLWDEKPQKYSRALLETLALIAYRQPITRGDIEEVRGVAVSSHIIKTLAERDWVKVVGHRDVPGRPALYATTKQFLDYFNLKSMDELPTLGELKDIDGLNQNLEFENALEKLSDDAEIVANPERDPDLALEDDSEVVEGMSSEEVAEGLTQDPVEESSDDMLNDVDSALEETPESGLHKSENVNAESDGDELSSEPDSHDSDHELNQERGQDEKKVGSE